MEVIMLKTVNLYALSRVTNEEYFNQFEKAYSRKTKISSLQSHEINSLNSFVDWMIECGVQMHQLDGFYFSFKIPQIGKEFDLLKFSENACLNIELKSEPVAEQKIKNQLIKNKHYLSHVNMPTYLFTIETQTRTCYTLNEQNDLIECNIETFVEIFSGFGEGIEFDIQKYFKASSYLVSPLNTPDDFIADKYFLTSPQEEIKRKLIDNIKNNNCKYYSIKGKPGTGKTLLIYDIAKHLANESKVLIVHCAKISNGQKTICKRIKNLDIVSASKLIEEFDFLTYDYILVDEAHRLYEKQFKLLIDSIEHERQICIFSSDPGQTLSHAEDGRNVVGAIEKLNNVLKFELSDKIRTNPELAAFIYSLMNLNRPIDDEITFENIDILYASNTDEAKQLIEHYREKGYVFINYSLSNYADSPFEIYDCDYDTHHVIGLEYDNVLMLLTDDFYYDENNILCAKQHPNPNYIYTKLFYQGVSRVREKLMLIVVGTPVLFQKILSVVDKRHIKQ